MTTPTKPISRDERRALTSVIKGEFDVLRLELRQHADTLKEQARTEVEAEYAAQVKLANANERKMRAKVKKFQGEVVAWCDDMRSQGFTSSNRRGYISPVEPIDWPTDWTPNGLSEAKRNAELIIERQRVAATTELARMEQDALREVNLSLITSPEAKTMLEKLIPNVHALMPTRPLAELRAG